MITKFKKLVDFLAKLPGIGPRQATRLVLAMTEWPAEQLNQMSEAVAELKKGHLFCRQCFNFTDDHLCSVCSSTKRDQTRIAVVERITDLSAMEKTGVYKGVYHVLGGAIDPIEGRLPDKLKISELKERVNKLRKLTDDVEIILATNPNVQGETTALYLEQEFKPFNIKITRLARGLSVGSSLEYSDETTLSHALKNRK